MALARFRLTIDLSPPFVSLRHLIRLWAGVGIRVLAAMTAEQMHAAVALVGETAVVHICILAKPWHFQLRPPLIQSVIPVWPHTTVLMMTHKHTPPDHCFEKHFVFSAARRQTFFSLVSRLARILPHNQIFILHTLIQVVGDWMPSPVADGTTAPFAKCISNV